MRRRKINLSELRMAMPPGLRRRAPSQGDAAVVAVGVGAGRRLRRPMRSTARQPRRSPLKTLRRPLKRPPTSPPAIRHEALGVAAEVAAAPRTRRAEGVERVGATHPPVRGAVRGRRPPRRRARGRAIGEDEAVLATNGVPVAVGDGLKARCQRRRGPNRPSRPSRRRSRKTIRPRARR